MGGGEVGLVLFCQELDVRILLHMFYKRFYVKKNGNLRNAQSERGRPLISVTLNAHVSKPFFCVAFSMDGDKYLNRRSQNERQHSNICE